LKKAFNYQLSAQKARIGEPENRGIGEEKIISPVLRFHFYQADR